MSEYRMFNNKENASSSGKIHKCKYCGKTFKTKQGLLYHTMKHEGNLSTSAAIVVKDTILKVTLNFT